MTVLPEAYYEKVDRTLLGLINDPEVQEMKYVHDLLLEVLLLHQTSKKLNNPILASCVDTLVTVAGTAPEKLPNLLFHMMKVLHNKEN